MDKRVRRNLFEPLAEGSLRAIIPDFTIVLPGEEVSAPAVLTCDGDQFVFTVHFNQPAPPAALNRAEEGKIYTIADAWSARGQINGEIGFLCSDIYPSFTQTTRDRGTSTVTFTSRRLDLIPEGTDTLTRAELQSLAGGEPTSAPGDPDDFYAHVIFHGPKLRLLNAGTDVVSKNDFLGEATSSSLDTHTFSTPAYEGALIQKGDELHLHLRSADKAEPCIGDPTTLVDSVIRAVAFTHGFNPWPVYRSLRVNHRVVFRRFSPRLKLQQPYLTPIKEALWFSAREDLASPIHTIIPTIASGWSQLSPAQQERLSTLHWNVRASALGDLPPSTKLLVLCSALDGLMKLIADQDLGTAKTWRAASDKLNLSWERWTNDIFELWGKHRHDLSHGRLWLPQETESADFLTDYPRLGFAFLTLISILCGYKGPVMADLHNRAIRISDIKKSINPEDRTP